MATVSFEARRPDTMKYNLTLQGTQRLQDANTLMMTHCLDKE
eukprot:gene35789-48127_t